MRIDLISMPWAIMHRPSIQLGALKSWLNRQQPELEVHCHHPYLSAARAIGLATYRRISENPWAGEALYGPLLFPEQRQEQARLFMRELPELASRFQELSHGLSDHLDQWLAGQDFSGSGLIGLSVCFSQLIPSLVLAARIKSRWPTLRIVFGGSTCTPQLGRGLLRLFDQVDFVIVGEGERPLAALCRLLARGEEPASANILRRDSPPAPPVLENREIPDPADLPIPDYHDYFRELAGLGLAFIPELPLEFSRGCWWNRCSFCNLNLQWCGYRARKHDQVLDQVRTLVRRHHCLDFFFTDNALPPAEAGRFFARTSRWDLDTRFFAEIRIPRSAAEWHRYRAGGLTSIQVGIEALSDSLLARMNKGTTGLDNIAAMKFAAEAGIDLDGNLILEFPGSTDREVAETLRLLELVLPYRPLAAASFFLGQGSPVSREPGRFGIRAVTPHPHNRALFPARIRAGLDLLILGYRGDRVEQRRRWRPVRRAIRAWHRFHRDRASKRPPLTMRDGGDFLLIRQERPGQPVLHHRLRGLSRRIYLACARPVDKKVLLERLMTGKEDQLTGFLRQMEEKKLMAGLNGRWLALAVAEPSPGQKAANDTPGSRS